MIEVTHLIKRYGRKTAIDDISFTINKGEIIGFLGPNGAGKSTTMNILTGYIAATYGDVKIDGINILQNPIYAKKKIGFLPEQPPLYPDMTVNEYLDFVCDAKGVKHHKENAISEVCQFVKIEDVRGRAIKNLSKGYRQRIGFAQALIGNPEILILDEPTAGLDPKQIVEIRNVIRDLGKDHTIIFSSHILSEITAVCSRILVIKNGVIVADDTPQKLSQAFSHEKKLVVRVSGQLDNIQKTIESISGVVSCIQQSSIEEGSFDFIIESEDNADIRADLFDELASKSYRILMLKPLELSLEEAFLMLTNDKPTQ